MTGIEEILGVMKTVHGLDISMFDHSFLVKSIEKMAVAANASKPGEYSALVASDRNAADSLLDSLKICYSEFFRNPLTFAVLEQLVLPGIIDEKPASSEIRIWSAACAAGQEPYSIAILLDDLIGRKEKKSRFRIFGTDVSEKELDRARKGAYTLSEIQKVATGMAQKYFRQKGDIYIVSVEIRDHVHYSFHDLLDPDYISPTTSIFGDFDLVCCSNLLFYYNPLIRQEILNRLYLSLAPGGYLVTGEAERDIVQRHKFIPVSAPSNVFRKIR